MKLSEDQLKEMENLSALQFSIDEIALALGVRSDALRRTINRKKSPTYKYYERGRIKSEAEVRKAILQMAKQGSTPAQKQMIELIERNKEQLADASSSTSRAARERAEARLKELEFKERSGELVPKEYIIQAGLSVVNMAKTRFLAIPARLAPQLVSESSIKKIKSAIEAEILSALSDLARLEKIQ